MSGVVSPTAGTRTEPIDSYTFVRGTTATFKMTFLNDGIPTTVDVSTIPVARILQPKFISNGEAVPQTIATISGTLVPGQQYEYQFVWQIPSSITPLDEWIVDYQAQIGGILNSFGDEFFTIIAAPGSIGLKFPSYATVDDVRQKKFNIDDFLPETIRADVIARNNLIEAHIKDAGLRLREELNLSKQRGNSANYRLFCIYYSIWSLLLAARGEDGSSVADQNIMFWRQEWERILAQLKRQSVAQGLPLGRG